MAKVLFIFGSTSGNTEMVVKAVAESVERKGHQVTVKRAELSEPKELLGQDLCVLASPTYGHGLMQYHMVAFAKGMEGLDLNGRSCAVIGLGDDKYDAYYNVESASLLEEVIRKANGKLALRSLRINKSPVPHLEGKIKKWAEKLTEVI